MTYLKRAVAIAGGVVLALLVFAPLIQVTDTSDYNIQKTDPNTGLPLYYPHGTIHELTGCFDNTEVINNIGFHGPDVEVQKKPGVFRIVVVGGSYVEGRQVSTDALLSTQLEQLLNADPKHTKSYEVIPIAFNGNSSFLDALYYKNYGEQLKPDLVIDLESQHELLYHLDAAPLDTNGKALLVVPPPPPDSVAKELLKHSKLLVNLYNRYLVFTAASSDLFKNPFTAFVGGANKTGTVDETARWNIKKPIVDAMSALVHTDNAKLLYATFVSNDQPSSAEGEFVAHFTQLAQKDDFSYLDLVPYVQAQEEQTGVPATFVPCDSHWTSAGHRYVAEALYQYLTEHPALLK